MKVKHDFVTNSSSSSFIVVFPFKIEKLEDVLKFIPKIEKANQVFKDSVDQIPIEIDVEEKEYNISLIEIIEGILRKRMDAWEASEIIEEIRNNIKNCPDVNGVIDKKEYIILKTLKPRNDWDYEFNDINENELENLIKNNEGGFIYRFSYSDEDGKFFSDMEHGDTFDNLSYIRISHH